MTGDEIFRTALESIQQGKYKKAIKLIDSFFQATGEVESLVKQSSVCFNEWEYINEISICEKTVNNHNSTFEGYLALSLVFKLVNNSERRLMYIDKASKINSNNFRIWREKGETAYKLGDIQKALHCFQEAINFNNKDPFCFEGIGLCYYYLDEPMKAINPLRKALELDPNNHCIMNHLSFLLSEMGELEEALTLIQKALQYDDKNNIYLDTYASILFLQEKYKESLEIFERILNNNPKNWEVSWDILAKLYKKLGLHVKAKQIEERLYH